MNPIIHMWSMLDIIYYNCSRLEYINKLERNIFRVKMITYKGNRLTLSDGTVLQHNDTVIKIHLHNCLLMREMRDMRNYVKRALYVQKRVSDSLPGLAQFVNHHPQRDDIKGILGITLLTRGVKSLGFDVMEISNPFYRRIKELVLIPIFILCNFPNSSLSRKKETYVPKYVVMSSQQLLNRYDQ